MGEDVADLADRDDRAAGARGPLQNIAVRRGHREILAVGGAGKVLGARADERPRDHAADVQRIAQAARDPAKIIEPLQPESLLMRGDLEHRIGGGVADGLQRPQVLLAVVLDDRGARSVAIGENSGELAFARSAPRSAPAERREPSPGNSPSRSRPACRRSPNGRTACPCRAKSRFHSPIGRAAREARSPGGARPVEAFIAWPSPSASRRGNFSGPRRNPSRSPRPSAQASAIWPSVSAPSSP